MAFYLARGFERFQDSNIIIKKCIYKTILFLDNMKLINDLIYIRYHENDESIYMIYTSDDEYTSTHIMKPNEDTDFPMYDLYEWLLKHLTPKRDNDIQEGETEE